MLSFKKYILEIDKNDHYYIIHGGRDFDKIDPKHYGSGEPGNIRPLGKGLYGFHIDPSNPEEAHGAINWSKRYASKYGDTLHVFKIPKTTTLSYNGYKAPLDLPINTDKPQIRATRLPINQTEISIHDHSVAKRVGKFPLNTDNKHIINHILNDKNIQEAPILNDIEKEPGLKPYDNTNVNREVISKLKGHPVSKFEGGVYQHYTLHEPKTNKISISLSARKVGDKTHVESVNGFGNKIPVHELYHHLITNHDVHLHSDYSLSKGAVHIWNNLHQMPGIKMQAYNMKDRNYTDIPKNQSLDSYMDKGSVRFAAKKDE